MSISGGPSIIRNDLSACYDASNKKSYVGSGTTWTDLIQGGGVTLSGLNSFASGSELNTLSAGFASIPFSFSSSMTFEMWYRTYTTASGAVNQFQSPGIMQLGNYASNASFTLWDWSVNTPNSHNIRTFINNGGIWTAVIDSNTQYADSAWLKFHQIAMVFSGSSGWGTYNMYVDCSLQGSWTISPTAITGSSLAGGNYLNFPAANGGATNNSYSYLKIYNRALSSNEILQNYNSIKGRYNL